MVADLAELHLNIHKLRSICSSRTHVEKCMIVLEDSTVVLLLDARELDINDSLFLGRDILCNIFLNTTKHEW